MVVWYCDVDMAEDANLTEDDMDLARTDGADLDLPECPGIEVCQGLPLCLIGGVGGGKGGWDGTETSLIVI